jgi:hypothetical protein
MKHGRIQRISGSLYLRIPLEFRRTNNLQHNDIALFAPVDGRSDKIEVTVMKRSLAEELLKLVPQSHSAPNAAPDQATQEVS